MKPPRIVQPPAEIREEAERFLERDNPPAAALLAAWRAAHPPINPQETP